MKYIYSLIRLVPDPLRGEFVNVGAIVGCEETGEWHLEELESDSRARYVARHVSDADPMLAVAAFRNRIGSLLDEYERSDEELVELAVVPSEAWLARLRADYQGVVQLGEVAYCSADSIEDAGDLVSGTFLVAAKDDRSRRFTRRLSVRAAVKRAYRKSLVEHAQAIRENVEIETKAGAHRTLMDFAIQNGSVVQLSQTWSFQVADQPKLAREVRAWGYTVERLKKRGASVLFRDGGALPVASDVQIEVVYAPPEDDREAPALKDALAVFDEQDVQRTVLGQEAAVAQRARTLLGA